MSSSGIVAYLIEIEWHLLVTTLTIIHCLSEGLTFCLSLTSLLVLFGFRCWRFYLQISRARICLVILVSQQKRQTTADSFCAENCGLLWKEPVGFSDCSKWRPSAYLNAWGRISSTDTNGGEETAELFTYVIVNYKPNVTLLDVLSFQTNVLYAYFN